MATRRWVREAVWRDPETRRWLGFGVLAGTFVLVSFHRVSSTVIAGDLMRTFETTGAELGFLHASFFYIYAVLQLPAGALIDRYGVRAVATAGTGLMSLGAFGFAAGETFAAALIARGVVGLGGSVLYLSVLRFCANWFQADEYATMTGLTIAGSGTGALIATTPFAVAVETIGWRESFVAVGGVGLLLAVGVAVVAYNTPERAGLPPIEGVPSAPTLSFASLLDNTRRVLRDPGTWVLGAILFISVGVSFTVLGLWAIPYMVNLYDVSVRQASGYVLVANLGFIAGPPTIGWLSDRFRRRTEFVVLASVVFTAVYATIAVVGTPPLVFVALLFLVSKFVGGGFSLAYTVVKERHPTEVSATATGAVNSIGWFGAAIYPAVLGAVLDVFWTGETVAGTRVYTELGYRAAFGITAVSGIVVFACAVWLYFDDRGD